MSDAERMKELNAIRAEAERLAERAYRWALQDYNDGIRRARWAYDAAMDAAAAAWRAGIDALDANEKKAE